MHLCMCYLSHINKFNPQKKAMNITIYILLLL